MQKIAASSLAKIRHPYPTGNGYEIEEVYYFDITMICTDTCPKGLNPAKALEAIRLLLVEHQV